MIETHALNALLYTPLRHIPAFHVLNFINGLVAPSFLFCAGFAYAIAGARKWDEYAAFGPGARAYTRRLLFILIVAYSLHLPYFSPYNLFSITDRETWISFFQIDVLQTISISLLLLLGGTILIKDQRRHRLAFLLISIAILVTTPLVNQPRYSWLPDVFGGLVSHAYQTPFPLFPWAVFLFGGYLVGAWFVANKELASRVRIQRIAIAGAALVAIAITVAFLPLQIYPGLPFWGDSPQFVLLRIGIVMLLLSFFYLFEPESVPNSGGKKIPFGLPLLFGRESLLVYTTHLLIVYGHDYPWSLVRAYGPNLSYSAAFGIFGIVTVGMYIAALGWHGLKQLNLPLAKKVQYALAAIILIRFVLGYTPGFTF